MKEKLLLKEAPNMYFVVILCQALWINHLIEIRSHPTLCEPMDCNMPGFPVLHHLLEFAQIHVH